MTLCPECGNPPAYHSFCTRCAKLFRLPARHWDRRWGQAERLEVQRIKRSQRTDARRRAKNAARRAEIAAILRPLHEADLIDTQVMAITGWARTRLAIYCRLIDIPLFRRRPKRPYQPPERLWTPERLAALEKLRVERNASFQICARELGVTRNAVSGAVWRYLPHLVRWRVIADVREAAR